MRYSNASAFCIIGSIIVAETRGPIMKWLKVLIRAAAKPAPKKRRASATASPGDRFTFPVVGESRYQDALGRIVGGHNREGHSHQCEATLIPEPTNPYDPQAIKVFIDGEPVGYIPNERTARLHKAMAGRGKLRCKARIDGGWRTNQHDAGHFGVKLAIPLRGQISSV